MSWLSRRSLLVGGGLALVGCGKGAGSRQLSGTATFPDSVGGGPVRNSRFVVRDVNQPGAPVVAEGRSDADGGWFVPEARGINVAVIFDRPDNALRVRVSGLTRPDETGFFKPLDGRTDIACEAGLSAVLLGIITAAQLNGELIFRLEEAAVPFVGRTNFRLAASVSSSALTLRQQILGR